MDEDVSARTQAEIAVKLSDNVRELVRYHIREALQDHAFIESISNPILLQNAMFSNAAWNSFFVQAVKNILTTQMSKP